MKKFTFSLVIFILLLSNTFAQNSLSGIVTDKNSKELLPGVFIYFPDLKKGTNTDSLGHYLMKNIPSGNFFIELKLAGYNSISSVAIIKGEVICNFSLEEAVTEVETIVITGVPSSILRNQNPIPIIIVPKETLLQNASTNMIDAIAKEPGVNQITTGAAISKPLIRGAGYNRVISLYNGVRQEGQQWGDEHGIEVDEYSIDRVEIIKGPGTLMYGSDGIGGAVNFLTPKAVPEGEIKGNILTNYQSNNHMIGYSLMNTGNIKGVEWLGRVSGKDAGNYKNKYDGRVFNSGFNEFDYNGYVGINKKWGYSQLHFTSFNQKIALPEGIRDSLGNFTKEAAVNDSIIDNITVSNTDLKGYNINVPYQSIRHNRVFWTNHVWFSKSSLRFTLGYQLNRRQEFGDAFNKNLYGLFFYLPTYTYDIKYHMAEFKGWTTTIGINGMYQKNLNKGIEFLIPEYELFDIGSFGYTKKSFDKIHISGGIRYEQRNFSSNDLYLNSEGQPVSSNTANSIQKFSALHKFYNNVSGSAGLTYDFSKKINLKGNISRGYRAPNIIELSSNGKHEGTFRFEYGNSELKPETSIQSDAGVSYTSKHVTFEGSFFNNKINNYIYAVRLQNSTGGDSIADPTDPVPAYKYGQNNAFIYGGELVLDIHPHPLDWLHIENTFSLARGKNKNQPDSSKYLPFMPAPRYLGRLKGNFEKAGKHFENVYVLMEVDHFFNQNQFLKENNTETFTKQYTLVNLGAGGNLKDKKGKVLFSIYFSANNIFNTAYQSNLNRLKYAPINPATGRIGVFNMGRNFSIKLSIPLDFHKLISNNSGKQNN